MRIAYFLVALSLSATAVAADDPPPRHYGIVEVPKLDGKKSLVVFVHGLNSDRHCWADLAKLLQDEKRPAAYFEYPNDQPIATSAALLKSELATLRAKQPKLRVDLVTHSMGALVARGYVEGESFAGDVRRLIMLAPPNHGSSCARWSFCSEWAEHCQLAYRESDWSWSWTKIDGRGEAGDNLMPESEFLAQLNARPRREGVQYSIIAGNRNVACRYGANVVEYAGKSVPESWRLGKAARRVSRAGSIILRSYKGDSDGLVDVESTHLDGVDDVVVAPGDHTTIFCARDGMPPVAWNDIKSRLAE